MINQIIDIAEKKMGYGQPCFIIAEAGVNHNGDMKLARKMIDVAKECGVDAIKFQMWSAESLVTKKEKAMAGYWEANMGEQPSQYEMLKKLEVSIDDEMGLMDYCKQKGIIFTTTPHGNEYGIKELEQKGILFYKIASGDVTNLPFLDFISKLKKPLIVATGMATMDEVKAAVKIFRQNKNENFVMLHCHTDYPTDPKYVNLRAMQTIQKECNCLVGYSDHTMQLEVGPLVPAMGGCVIEKHFTLSRKMEGPDHVASLEPPELKELVQRIRRAEIILGSYEKKPTEKELIIMPVARKSLIARTDIKKGAKITLDMLVVKRPGDGIPSKDIHKVLGKKAKVDIEEDTKLRYDMLQ